MEFLTAKETLETKCEENPINYKKDGSIQAIVAGTSALVGVGLGFLDYEIFSGGFETLNSVWEELDGLQKGIAQVLVGGGLGVLSLAAEATAVWNAINAYTAIRDSDGPFEPDGHVYTRFQKFTDNPTGSDKKFGDKVIPVDSIDEFDPESSDMYLFNGVSPRITFYHSIKSRFRRRDYTRRIHVKDGKKDGKINRSYLNFEVDGTKFRIVAKGTVWGDKLMKLPTGYEASILIQNGELRDMKDAYKKQQQKMSSLQSNKQ